MFNGLRSVTTDGFQTRTGSTTLVTGVKNDVEIIIDYPNDLTIVNVNNQRDITGTGLSFGNTSYTAGSPNAPDGILGSSISSLYSNATIHYLIVQRDGAMDETSDSLMTLNPYEILIPE